jgi:hypothetical protein
MCGTLNYSILGSDSCPSLTVQYSTVHYLASPCLPSFTFWPVEALTWLLNAARHASPAARRLAGNASEDN